MHEEMRDIDEMWHEFILITIDYHAFCNEYFGEYLHHIPNIRAKMQLNAAQFEKELMLSLDFVYEQLGEESLAFWFRQHLDHNVDLHNK